MNKQKRVTNHRSVSYQQDFLDRLRGRFTKKAELVSAMEEALHLGRDAIYRRLRGETVLSADELYVLADTFQVPLAPRSARHVTIRFPASQLLIEDEVAYYRAFQEHSDVILGLDNLNIDYATPDLPLYFELSNPTLLAFKTYVYGLTTWRFDKWERQAFNPGLIHPDVYRIAEEQLDKLFDIPGRQLWSLRIIDVTLRQLEHCVQIGRLRDREVIRKLYDELVATVDHLIAMARSGKRYRPGQQPAADALDLQLYHSEMANTNAVMLIRGGGQRRVFSSYVSPSYTLSDDPRVVDYMDDWFERVITTSSPLYGDGLLTAERFFNQLHYAINQSRERVNVMTNPTTIGAYGN